MQRIYGWSEAEALARFQQLIRPEILKPYRSERLAKDGSLVKVWMTATTLVNKDGQVNAVATTERRMPSAETA